MDQGESAPSTTDGQPWWQTEQFGDLDPADPAITHEQEAKEKAKKDQEALAAQRIAEASHILETLVKKDCFSEGDQDLFAKAFKLMAAESGRVGYDVFWLSLAFVAGQIPESDRVELFNKASWP